MLAAQQGDTANLKALLTEGANIQATAKDGDTALHLTASKGHTQTVQTLLAAGADIEPKLGTAGLPCI